MKNFTALAFAFFCFLAVNGQTDSSISSDNDLYMEWVGENGFRMISEFKASEATFLADEILDEDGNSIPSDVNSENFDITKYDFNTVVAPERNIIIKVTEDKGIFIYSKHRQEVLFSRFLTNQKAKSQK